MEYTQQATAEGGVQYFLSGKLTAHHHQVFLKLLKELENAPFKQYAFNLSGLEFIDSGGLGMLLLANDTCKKQGNSFKLEAPTGNVQKILKLSHFEKIMTVSVH
jgi:anti-anti-sigma factor